MFLKHLSDYFQGYINKKWQQQHTRAPPCGWCTITLACGKACLKPGLPAVKSREPMLQACPIHHVEIGG